MDPGPACGGSFLLLDVITREPGDVLAAIKATRTFHQKAHLVREQTLSIFLRGDAVWIPIRGEAEERTRGGIMLFDFPLCDCNRPALIRCIALGSE